MNKLLPIWLGIKRGLAHILRFINMAIIEISAKLTIWRWKLLAQENDIRLVAFIQEIQRKDAEQKAAKKAKKKKVSKRKSK